MDEILPCLGYASSGLFPMIGCATQRVLSTYMVECRVSILGLTIMIWGGMPHNST